MPPKDNSGGNPPDDPKNNSNLKLYLELRPQLLDQLLARYPLFAEDAIQETYLAIRRTGVRLEKQDDPAAYLFSMVINEIRNLASKGSGSQQDLTDIERLAKSAAQTHTDIDEVTTEVDEALAELPELEQRVYELKVYHGLPTRVSAKLLNISHFQAQRALTSARRHIKAFLSNTTQGRRK
ncbi:MAG: sigma-70 family RNA polymerase sigma factor [Gammaproteobacteria bacterium]